MLDPLIVTLEIIDNKLVARSEEATLGSQYDHLMRSIEIVRPEGFAEDELLLYFADKSGTVFDPVNLGVGNTYPVPRLLTHTLRLNMQAAIQRDGLEIAHSDTLRLSLNASLPPKLPPPDVVLDLYNIVQTELVHEAEQDGDRVVLKSLLGDELGTFEVGGDVALEGYATEEYVDEQIAAIEPPDVDLSGYATEQYVDERIADIEIPDVDLSDYYTSGEVDDKIAAVELTPGPPGPPGEDGYTPVKDVDYFDGQDGADGKAATITIGTVTDGDEVSVTNVGTATDAVLDFVLRRGEPGSGGGDDLPWVSGHFQDRSIAANITTVLTPIFERGDETLIDGAGFVARTSGVYVLIVGGGQFQIALESFSHLYHNTQDASGIICTIKHINSSSVPTGCGGAYMDVDDRLYASLHTLTATSSFSASSSRRRFLFMRVR